MILSFSVVASRFVASRLYHEARYATCSSAPNVPDHVRFQHHKAISPAANITSTPGTAIDDPALVPELAAADPEEVALSSFSVEVAEPSTLATETPVLFTH